MLRRTPPLFLNNAHGDKLVNLCLIFNRNPRGMLSPKTARLYPRR